MMKIPFALCLLAGLGSAIAEPQTFTATFEDERPADWSVNCGEWVAKDGALHCGELEADNHAAASRWKIPFQDAVIEARLKLGGAKAFHIGFDPAPGALKKKGHLYSFIIMPSGARIMKHVDKADPNSKNEVLATGKVTLSVDQWIDIRLEAKGDQVSVALSSSSVLAAGDQAGSCALRIEASDPTFHVPKPGIVFRCAGETAQLDEIAVVVKK